MRRAWSMPCAKRWSSSDDRIGEILMFEFKLPDIGEGVVEGEIVKWLVKEGDRIGEDQPMVEVMTDKATVEIPSPRAGVVAKIHVPEGKVCKVGQVMLAIETAGGNGQPQPQPHTHTPP